jgi:site-specific DNA-cytosine methylase
VLNDNSGKIILDLCGGTGAWSRPYKEAGYDVRVITLPEYDVRLFPSQPSNISRYPSEFQDIEPLLGRVYGILAAPVCTYFSASGARHPRSDAEIQEALSIVDACLRIIQVLRPNWWALENPIGKLRKWIGPPVMVFNPCDYGDPYTKKTLLWGEFNIPVKNPVEPTEGSKLWRNYGGKSAKTKEARSITPPGFAKAFFLANQ